MVLKRMILTLCGKVVGNVYQPPGGILFPSCHIVSDITPSHVRCLYRVPTIDKFRSDLDLLTQKYEPLPLSELQQIGRCSQNKRNAQYFVLSFDDGMREAYDIIAPILREKGLQAIFFLNSATVDNKLLMWRHKIGLLIACAEGGQARFSPELRNIPGNSVRDKLLRLRFSEEGVLDEVAKCFGVDFNDYLHTDRPYLTSAQVLELAHAGFEFGAHSDTHPSFVEIPVKDQKEQISKSVDFIRDLGLPCHYFAFPFNDNGVSNCVFEHLKRVGVVLSFGTSDARLDSIPFSFQRFFLDADNSDLTIPELLNELSAKTALRHLSGTEVISRN